MRFSMLCYIRSIKIYYIKSINRLADEDEIPSDLDKDKSIMKTSP